MQFAMKMAVVTFRDTPSRAIFRVQSSEQTISGTTGRRAIKI